MFTLPRSGPFSQILSHIVLSIKCNCPLSVSVTCGQPASPSEGHVDTSAGASFGDVAKYSCDVGLGYTLNGTAERTCQANGQWSGSVPTCESETLGACNGQIYFLCT